MVGLNLGIEKFVWLYKNKQVIEDWADIPVEKIIEDRRA